MHCEFYFHKLVFLKDNREILLMHKLHYIYTLWPEGIYMIKIWDLHWSNKKYLKVLVAHDTKLFFIVRSNNAHHAQPNPMIENDLASTVKYRYLEIIFVWSEQISQNLLDYEEFHIF